MPQRIDVPGHGIVEFPDGMSDDQISAAIKANMSQRAAPSPEMNAYLDQKKAREGAWKGTGKGLIADAAAAVVEPALKMASGVVAKPISDVAGLTAAGYDRLRGNKEGDPQGFRDFVRESLTYEPRTTGGQIVDRLNPVNAVGALVNAGTSGAAGLVSDDPNSSTYQGVKEALNQAIGFAGVRGNPVTRGAGNAAQKVTDALVRTGNAVRPTAIAEKKLVDLAGDNRALVADSLAKGTEYVPGSRVTSQEAIAQGNLESPQAHGAGLVKLQQDLTRVPGYTQDTLATIERGNEGARRKAIQQLGAGLPESIAAREARAAENYGVSDAATLPGRERQYAAQKIGTVRSREEIDPILSQPVMKEIGRDSVTNMPIIGPVVKPGGAPIHKQVLAGYEYDPGLKALLDRPAISTAFSTAEKLAENNGASLFDKDGKISGRGAHFVKLALDDAIDPKPATAAGRNAANSIKSAKVAYLNWVEDNVPAYKKARTDFAEDSAPVNQKMIAQTLERKLTGPRGEERAGQFANAVREAPATIKRSTGQDRFQRLDQVMTPEQMKVVDALSKDLDRDAMVTRMNRETSAPGDTTPQVPQLPMMLNPAVSVANKAARHVFGDLNQKANKIATDILADPAKLREVMSRPKSDGTRKVVESILRAGQMSAPYQGDSDAR